MFQRERFLKTMTFQPVDRVPLVEWNIREATMQEWIKQGYPEGIGYQSFFGLDNFYINVPIHLGMYPAFKEKIIERNGKYKIWQDELGAVRKDFIDDDTPGFVTRQWLEFVVKGRSDFLKIKQKYDSKALERYPKNWAKISRVISQSHVPVHLSIPFLFWTVRDWMGFENLCMAFYDDPTLVQEMFKFLADFYIDTLIRGINDVDIDVVELKEDMAYKHAPMISPEMFYKFMFPHYVRIIDFLKNNGVKLVYVDCDGYPGDLIPLWIEAGVDAMSPCEIAAGNDMLVLRKQYPRFGLFGGVDKRILAKDRKAIYQEVMSKIPCMIEKGGYIPHVDHAIPPDVPLENYLYYREILTRAVYGEPIIAP